MFARPLVVFVCWTRATVRQTVANRHEVLVVARIFVARVANEHTLFDQFKLEGFVLNPLQRPFGHVEAVK
ncbi:hypothetical protein [Saliphagus sp. LR7]|uniref:hypothetical protein n=1 Tax=Saliphagus sp. LR7 TaxID=2282654 RepID=UPI001E3FB1DF|nr:hypothetical protein [Saliphagus sp. LR7]